MVQIRVPFLDLNSQVEPIRSELFQAIEASINASDFVLGPSVRAFEDAFAEYSDCRHAVGVNSGTDALLLALRALGVGPGDEVITAPNMFIAAVEAIALVGATPVLVDVREDTFLIDPARVESAITERTKAVIPVHLFGAPCDMDALMQLAERHGIHVIEDACQAHGALYRGRKAGSLGHVAAFSFYPTKNLGGFGDGGAVTTNDDAIADRVRSLRHHGQREKNTHTHVGMNSRLDGLQAAVLKTKLPYLDGWNERRRQIAGKVRSALEGSEFGVQKIDSECSSSFHILAVRHPRRELVHERLDQSGIGWGNHIPRSIHEQPGYRFLGLDRGALPVSEQLCDELVSLPVCPSLTDEQVDYMIDSLSKVGVTV